MPKCSPTPMSRPPAWNSLNLPANQAQVVKTGQSPGKPATTHQVPSCGVIQITHNDTNKKFICSTVDVKKTLQGFFNSAGNGALMAHPAVVDCYNGGDGSVRQVKVCGGYPAAGGSFSTRGVRSFGAVAGGGVNFTVPVYNPITSPGPISCFSTNNYGFAGGGGGGVGLIGSCTFTVPVHGNPRQPSNDLVVKPSRPSSKDNWSVEWLIRRNVKGTTMTNLATWEVGLKNIIQPELNSDKQIGGSTYSFCGPKTPGSSPIIVCPPYPLPQPTPPKRKGGGFCSTPNLPKRGNQNGSGPGGSSRCGPAGCCGSGGPDSVPRGDVLPRREGPWADMEGGRLGNTKTMRNMNKSVGITNVLDRENLYSNTNLQPLSYENNTNLLKGPLPGGSNVMHFGSLFEGRGTNARQAIGGVVYGRTH